MDHERDWSGKPTLSRWAVAALVVGIAGIGLAASKLQFPVAASIVAVGLASYAKVDIGKSLGAKRGLGLAKAASLLGAAGILVRLVIGLAVEQDQEPLLVLILVVAVVVILIQRLQRKSEEI